MAYNGPTKCAKCEELGCPTEGMTAQCSKCGKIFCFGHYGNHRKEEHNLCYLCDEKLPCPEHGGIARTRKKKKIPGTPFTTTNGELDVPPDVQKTFNKLMKNLDEGLPHPHDHVR